MRLLARSAARSAAIILLKFNGSLNGMDVIPGCDATSSLSDGEVSRAGGDASPTSRTTASRAAHL